MKLTIARTDLLAALSTVKPAAKGSTLPVLSHVAINTFEKSVEFLCSNLDLTLRSKCEADVSKKGCTTVRCSLLHALVSSFTGDEVELELVKDLVHVRCGTSKYQLATLPFEEFPVATKLKDALEFSLPQHTLRGLLHATSFCQSTDESRYILCGSLVSLNGTLTLVSTDGRRLARMNYKADDLGKLEREFILPRFAVNELNRLLSTDEAAAELVRIQATENAAEFKLGDTLIITKLIEGNYPNYKQVIPSTREIHPVTLSRTELLDCLKRVAFIANCGVGSCKLEFRKQTLTLSAESNKDNVGVAHERRGQRPRPMRFSIATETRWRGSLHRFVGHPSHFQRLTSLKNKCTNRSIPVDTLTISGYGRRMKEIKVEITRTTKPYVGLITGADAQYGFALEFLPMARKSASYHTAVITAPGQYKLSPGAVACSRRIDTGYIRVSDAGEITEIQKSEVVL